MSHAIRAARHSPSARSEFEHADAEPSRCTTIAGRPLYRRRFTVGWVGDSRAYWVSPLGSELLTQDHSWANETVARGEMTEAQAMAAPLAHALTRCLGPLEVEDEIVEIDPDVRAAADLLGTRAATVLCTDGQWNYFRRPRRWRRW